MKLQSIRYIVPRPAINPTQYPRLVDSIMSAVLRMRCSTGITGREAYYQKVTVAAAWRPDSAQFAMTCVSENEVMSTSSVTLEVVCPTSVTASPIEKLTTASTPDAAAITCGSSVTSLTWPPETRPKLMLGCGFGRSYQGGGQNE